MIPPQYRFHGPSDNTSHHLGPHCNNNACGAPDPIEGDEIPFEEEGQIPREYVIKLTDKDKEALRKSEVNGPSYHLIKQILKQNNSKTWGDVLCETE
jgi:hypothetical protein